MTKMILLASSSVAIYSKNQMMMVLAIIASCCMLSSLMFFLSNTHWFSLLMLLIYISGVMVLFMFIVSMSPNEKSPLKYKNKKLMVILLATLMVPKINLWSENLKFNSSIEQSVVLMSMVTLVILMMAYLPPKTISSFYSGMKSSK